MPRKAGNARGSWPDPVTPRNGDNSLGRPPGSQAWVPLTWLNDESMLLRQLVRSRLATETKE